MSLSNRIELKEVLANRKHNRGNDNAVYPLYLSFSGRSFRVRALDHSMHACLHRFVDSLQRRHVDGCMAKSEVSPRVRVVLQPSVRLR